MWFELVLLCFSWKLFQVQNVRPVSGPAGLLCTDPSNTRKGKRIEGSYQGPFQTSVPAIHYARPTCGPPASTQRQHVSQRGQVTTGTSSTTEIGRLYFNLRLLVSSLCVMLMHIHSGRVAVCQQELVREVRGSPDRPPLWELHLWLLQRFNRHGSCQREYLYAIQCPLYIIESRSAELYWTLLVSVFPV